MKKSGKYIAFGLLVILVIGWIVVCKPFSSTDNMEFYDAEIIEAEDSQPVSVADETQVVEEAKEPDHDVTATENIEEQPIEETQNDSQDIEEASAEDEIVDATEVAEVTSVEAADSSEDASPEEIKTVSYRFRNKKLLNQHYEKHGIEMGFASAAEYEAAASAVINNPNALSKIEAEDGDYVYYVESSNEFVILSTDGYIRTYFNPSKGIAYYNRQ